MTKGGASFFRSREFRFDVGLHCFELRRVLLVRFVGEDGDRFNVRHARHELLLLDVEGLERFLHGAHELGVCLIHRLELAVDDLVAFE